MERGYRGNSGGEKVISASALQGIWNWSSGEGHVTSVLVGFLISLQLFWNCRLLSRFQAWDLVKFPSEYPNSR